MRQFFWLILGTIIICSSISCSGPMDLGKESSNVLTSESKPLVATPTKEAPETLVTFTPSILTPSSDPLITPLADNQLDFVEGIDPPVGLVFCSHGELSYIDKNHQPFPFAPCDSIISPNNRYAAFIGDTLNNDIWIQDLFSGEIINLTRSVEKNQEYSSYPQLGVWSPDSEYFFFLDGEDFFLKDIWSINIVSGEKRNLSNTPDRDESRLQYWPAQDSLLFYSHSKEEEVGPFGGGYLTLMTTTGYGYRLLSDELDSVIPQISPDGRAFALYDGYLYDPATGIRKLELQASGPGFVGDVYLNSPAWSADSQKIAWTVSVTNEDGMDENDIGVLDLSTNELSIFHPHVIYMGEGNPPASVWSPDGNWLAYEEFDDTNQEPISLWVVSTDGLEEYKLGSGENPVWKPDSSQLAYTSITETEVETMVVDIGVWQPKRINRMENADLKRWYVADSIPDWVEDINLSGEIWDLFEVTIAGANLNMREEPSLKADVIQQLNPGDTFEIIDYPAYNDRYRWWKIRTSSGVEGWIVEHNGWYKLKE